MFRIILGLVKGGVLGAAIGAGAWKLGLGGGVMDYAVLGIVGSVVGLLVGRPFWSHLSDPESTAWTAWMKAIFGAGIVIGLFVLTKKFAPDPTIALLGEERPLTHWPFLTGGALGALYGAWVELDDPPKKRQDKNQGSSTSRSKATTVRRPS